MFCLALKFRVICSICCSISWSRYDFPQVFRIICSICCSMSWSRYDFTSVFQSPSSSLYCNTWISIVSVQQLFLKGSFFLSIILVIAMAFPRSIETKRLFIRASLIALCTTGNDFEIILSREIFFRNLLMFAHPLFSGYFPISITRRKETKFNVI